MKSVATVLLFSLLAIADAVELTKHNFDESVAGKTVFIKFFAPWCGHCKAMAPAWDRLTDAFADSETALVAKVDCTDEDNGGDELCQVHGVEGFPTLKWGDPTNLVDYTGERDYDDLYEFAKENLKPMCSPANIDLCETEKKSKIEEYMKMATAADGGKALDELIEGLEKEIVELDEKVAKEIEKLQERYEQIMKETDESKEIIKNKGLGLMRACKAHAKKSAINDEL